MDHLPEGAGEDHPFGGVIVGHEDVEVRDQALDLGLPEKVRNLIQRMTPRPCRPSGTQPCGLAEVFHDMMLVDDFCCALWVDLQLLGQPRYAVRGLFPSVTLNDQLGGFFGTERLKVGDEGMVHGVAIAERTIADRSESSLHLGQGIDHVDNEQLQLLSWRVDPMMPRLAAPPPLGRPYPQPAAIGTQHDAFACQHVTAQLCASMNLLRPVVAQAHCTRSKDVANPERSFAAEVHTAHLSTPGAAQNDPLAATHRAISTANASVTFATVSGYVSLLRGRAPVEPVAVLASSTIRPDMTQIAPSLCQDAPTIGQPPHGEGVRRPTARTAHTKAVNTTRLFPASAGATRHTARADSTLERCPRSTHDHQETLPGGYRVQATSAVAVGRRAQRAGLGQHPRGGSPAVGPSVRPVGRACRRRERFIQPRTGGPS